MENRNNLETWNSLAKPPQWALKPIKGGRMSGSTDINPTWRMEAATEAFGPVGFGWKYTIDRQWTEMGADGEVMSFCNISFYYKLNGEWSDAIPGTGGNTLVVKESRGMYNNDEAFKMALTDALSVAMKAIGVGSDVYKGFFDSSKYQNREQPNNGQSKPAEKKEPTSVELAIKGAKGKIVEALKPKGYDANDVAKVLGDTLKHLNASKTPEDVKKHLDLSLGIINGLHTKAVEAAASA